METIIKKILKARNMIQIFDDYNINIRYFDNLTIKTKPELEKSFSENIVYLFEIKIRHSENENPKELFKNELKKITLKK